MNRKSPGETETIIALSEKVEIEAQNARNAAMVGDVEKAHHYIRRVMAIASAMGEIISDIENRYEVEGV